MQKWYNTIVLPRALAPRSGAAMFTHVDTHARPNSFGGDFGPQKPDFAILLASLAHLSLDDDASLVCALMEIKKGARDHFDDNDMGQALDCGHRMFRAKPGLQRLLVALANTATLQLWELHRRPAPEAVIVIDFGAKPLATGLGYLVAGLERPSFLSQPSRAGAVSTGVLLGLGATSAVFAVAGDDTLLVKEVYAPKPPQLEVHMVDRERAVLKALSTVPHVIRLASWPAVPEDSHALVLSPRGTPLTPATLKGRPALITDLVRALQSAHTAGYVHCDLRFANLYLDNAQPEGRLVIADWGFAFHIAVDKPRPWAGTVSTASKAVLAALGARKGDYTPCPADDLESCVKLARLAAGTEQAASKRFENAVAVRDCGALAAFWQWQLFPPAWASALDFAQRCDYGSLAVALENLLR